MSSWRWFFSAKHKVEASRVLEVVLVIVIERGEILGAGQEIPNLDRPNADVPADPDIKPAVGRHRKARLLTGGADGGAGWYHNVACKRLY